MAIIEGGIFGNLRGRLGNRVYYMLRGKQVSRVVGRKVKPPSAKQLINQMELKVLSDFLTSVKEFIKLGFGPEAVLNDMYPHNIAVRHNKRFAQSGEYPHIVMDYQRVLLSKGTLPGLTDVSVRLTGDADEGYSLVFKWTLLPADKDWPRCNDQVMLLAYFPEEGMPWRACYSLAGAKRGTGQDILHLPTYMSGQRMEIYVSVISEDRRAVADSQHLIFFI